MRTRMGLAGAAVLVTILTSVAAHGEIRPCPGLGLGSPTFNILLDDLHQTETVKSDPLLADFTTRLRHALRSRLDGLTPSGGVVFEVLQCGGRKPVNASEFDDDALVAGLARSNVVLEVWGVLDGTATGGEIRERRAAITYFVVPVRADRTGAERRRGMFAVAYPKVARSATDFLELFEEAGEIEAYVSLGVGLRKLRDGDTGQAREYLCRAQHLVQKAWGTAPRPGSQEEAFLTYLRAQAARALAAEPGARLVGANAQCPGAEN
jgi:hypothetical protein